MKNKVLIVTYYWPPSGGSGVQRWLKFVKYLPSYGWEPHVFTPENPSFAVQDPSLEKDVPAEAEVIKFPIWEPYDVFFRIAGWFGSKKGRSRTTTISANDGNIFQNLAAWMRGNLFVPDPRRFWVSPSVTFLSEYLVDNQIKTIVTTGPPHSIHLIGLKLKERFPDLRWIADFRDPWSEWGLLDSLKVSRWVRALHRRLEARVLSNADEVTTITPFYSRRFAQLANRHVRLLTNGYDEDDFKAIELEKTEKFVIRHVGIINEKCDPRPFLLSLEIAIKNDPNFARDIKLEFIGQVHERIESFVKERHLLRDATSFVGHVPHERLLKMYGSSSLLLLVLTGYKDAEGYLPGKMFEYLATGLPVIGIGPVTGDAATVLKQSGAGRMLETYDQGNIVRELICQYERWRSTGAVQVEKVDRSQFSRREITGRLVQMLNEASRSDNLDF